MKTQRTTLHNGAVNCAIKRNQSMKTHIKNQFTSLGVARARSRRLSAVASVRRRILPTLIAGLGWMMATSAPAQTFTTLYRFTATSDGAFSLAGLLLSGNTLYGTAYKGGASDEGTVFAVNTDGTGFTNLHSFTAVHNRTNSDGANPYAGLILSSNTLYGTAYLGGGSGGDYGSGTVFAVNTDGTGFTNLHTFTADEGLGLPNSDGAGPLCCLLLSGDTLYGTANKGGSSDQGTVFAVNTNGTGFTNLHSFTALSGGTNSDGANPCAGLILSGNTLYGTTDEGSTNGNGTVFAVNTDGTGLTNLHTFTSGGYNAQFYVTNSDGANPDAVLLLSGNTLYGTTSDGGPSGYGTVFKVNTDGTGFTNLHYFTATTGAYPNVTNSDGAFPNAGLILSGNTLYGIASSGGTNGNGTVFAVNTDGTGFTIAHIFTATSGPYSTNSDGALPQGGLILSGNILYGTTPSGGPHASGTVFSITLPAPQLNITTSGTNIILTWPTNYAGFSDAGYTLLSTTNLASPAVWATNSPAPVVANGQFTVTNPITGTQQFFQLSQ
jgi:uncharacterized repeat protein (TIGR03803 family)